METKQDRRGSIRLVDISKSYGETEVLRKISLDIEPHSFVALVGQSGAGKTTLLKTINRLVEPDKGKVAIGDVDAIALDLTALRHSIGYVFQGIGLFPHMTVAENIWLSPRLQNLDPAGRTQRVAELLDMVSLPVEMGTRYPAQLSGGQAQRVGFARALAVDPQIMLMDEPFGALDPMTRVELGQAYRRLHDRLGLTSVMVTHDLAEAMLLADRVLVMEHGLVVADLTPGELMRAKNEGTVGAMVGAVRAQAGRLEALMQGA